jgi:hypothetical protein
MMHGGMIHYSRMILQIIHAGFILFFDPESTLDQ